MILFFKLILFSLNNEREVTLIIYNNLQFYKLITLNNQGNNNVNLFLYIIINQI